VLDKKLTSSEILAAVSQKGFAIVNGLIIPIFTIINGFILLVVLTAIAFYIEPQLTVYVISVLCIIYILIVTFVKKILDRHASNINEKTTQVLEITNEASNSIDLIYLEDRFNFFIDKFSASTFSLQRSWGMNQSFQVLPKVLVELILMLALVTIIYFIASSNLQLSTYASTFGFVVFAASRMIPLSQQLFGAWGAIKTNHYFVQDAIELMIGKSQGKPFLYGNLADDFFNNLKLDSIGLIRGDISVLQNISFELKRGDKVGIIGKTGCGKTSLMRIMLGLAEPSEGAIFVNNKQTDIFKSKAWLSNISYVPQKIYLLNTSIKNNITFGASEEEIDLALLDKCCEIAQLKDIISGLPNGIDTEIGENGSNISGGESQRIGIARAIYKQPTILFLDEATSALDGNTEKSLMHALLESDPSMTIIMISHNRSSLNNFNKIISLSNGMISSES